MKLQQQGKGMFINGSCRENLPGDISKNVKISGGLPYKSGVRL